MKKILGIVLLTLFFCNTVQALPKCEGSEFEWTNCKGTRIYNSFEDDGAGTYQGEFYDTLRHGKGTMTYLNGDKYVGSWKSGSKNGYGKYYYKDGSSITSIWINGKSIYDIIIPFSPLLILIIIILLLKFFAKDFYSKLKKKIILITKPNKTNIRLLIFFLFLTIIYPTIKVLNSDPEILIAFLVGMIFNTFLYFIVGSGVVAGIITVLMNAFRTVKIQYFVVYFYLMFLAIFLNILLMFAMSNAV